MIIFPVLLGLLPGFAWLFFFMQEDSDGEPKSLIVRTFLAGAASALFVLIVQLLLRSFFTSLNITAASVISLVALALAEEVFKFAGAYFTVHDHPSFDVPVDGMIYMMVAGLGFATVENLAIASSALTGSQLFFEETYQTLTLRFIGATLLHALVSALVGYYWAISILKFYRMRILIMGIVLATLLHAFFNYLILSYGNLMYSIVFVAVAGFFVLSDFEELSQHHVNIRD